MNTRKFRTKTEIIMRNNGHIPGISLLALDIGYSAVKGFSSNSVIRFPSYAKRVEADFAYAGTAPAESILYKDLDTNEMWLVGEIAENLMESGDTTDSENMLYGRDRYENPMFKVIARVGMGLGLVSNQYGTYDPKEKIVLQTGLPERYMNDADLLKQALAGKHNFEVKVGTGEWMRYYLDLDINDIYVMNQPKGTLYSTCIGKDGQFHKDASEYLKSSVLVVDPGFGTLDIFPIKSGVVGKGETFPDLGMRRIFSETARLIKENYNIDVSVPQMQKYLETGTVKYVNKKTFESKEYSFDIFLAQSCKEVCEEAINRISTAVNLIDFRYMIITGGTGAAWEHYIMEKFKNFSTLKILKGNQNDDLPLLYANARGYYLCRLNIIGKEKANEG